MNPDLLPAVPSGVTLTPQEIATDTYCVGWPNCTGDGQQFVIIPSELLNPNVQQLISKYFPKDRSIDLSQYCERPNRRIVPNSDADLHDPRFGNASHRP